MIGAPRVWLYMQYGNSSWNSAFSKQGVAITISEAMWLYARLLFFLRTRNGRARLCIKLAENAKE
jgi:hypothetical protein